MRLNRNNGLAGLRNNWLAGLTCQQFVNLNPWDFITHPASNGQWLGSIRSVLSTRLTDDELLSIVYPGLHTATTSAIRNHAKRSEELLATTLADLESRDASDADRKLALLNHGIATSRLRAKCLVGYALSYIEKYGLAEVVRELPGNGTYSVNDLDTISLTPRAHALQHEYMLNSSNYNDSLSSLPQFLSDGIVLSDEGLQQRHQNIEQIRRFLTPRQHQILRLAVIEQQAPSVMSEMLGLTTKQVWKVRRALNAKLGEIAEEVGVCPRYIASVRQKSMMVEAE